MGQWFLTEGTCPPGGVNKFPGGNEPYARYDMESLIIKFTSKYTCFYSLFKVMEVILQANLTVMESRDLV